MKNWKKFLAIAKRLLQNIDIFCTDLDKTTQKTAVYSYQLIYQSSAKHVRSVCHSFRNKKHNDPKKET